MLLSTEKYLTKKEKQGWFTRNLFAIYEKGLIWSLKFKRTILVLTGVVFVVSIFALAGMGRSFLPDFNEGALTISAVSKPGISLEESNKLGNLMEMELLKIPEVQTTTRRTGRGELDEHSQTTNSAEIDVNYVLDERDNDAFMENVRQTLAAIPGIAATVGQPLGHRIDHMLSGTRANIAIKLFGNDLNKLFEIGNQVKSAVTNVEGLVDVNVEQQVEIPQIQIRANRDMLAAYGITIERFNAFIDIAFAGEKLADIYEGQKSFDLIVRLNKDYTETRNGLENALITAADGKKVPLSEVAEIVSASGPSSISRENVQRKVVVSANVAGRDLLGVVNEIKENVNKRVIFPEGYRIEYGGQFESEARASKTLLFASMVSLSKIRRPKIVNTGSSNAFGSDWRI